MDVAAGLHNVGRPNDMEFVKIKSPSLTNRDCFALPVLFSERLNIHISHPLLCRQSLSNSRHQLRSEIVLDRARRAAPFNDAHLIKCLIHPTLAPRGEDGLKMAIKEGAGVLKILCGVCLGGGNAFERGIEDVDIRCCSGSGGDGN